MTSLIPSTGEGLKAAELISQPDTSHRHSFFDEGLVEAVTVVMVLALIEIVDLFADFSVALNLGE